MVSLPTRFLVVDLCSADQGQASGSTASHEAKESSTAMKSSVVLFRPMMSRMKFYVDGRLRFYAGKAASEYLVATQCFVLAEVSPCFLICAPTGK
jgi:hypothetical protein